MIDRREFFGITAGAGAALALTPELLYALRQPGGKLIQRAIPSSGEMLPVIGLSRGNDAVDPGAFREVLKTLVDNGGRVVDIQHGGAPAEQISSTIANELGIQDRIFWSLRGSPPGPPQPATAAKAYIETLFAKFKVPKIDLLLVPAMADPALLAVLKEAKKEGRVRYIGVQAISDPQYTKLEAIMREEPIDFIGVDYAIDNRGVEQTILPLAQERKIGVLAYFPMGGNIGPDGHVTSGLLRRAGSTPLPEWAAELDAGTWAQFFLKYVVSHPAVTVARAGTSQSKHMLDNLAGGIGRLPNEATRKRMAELVDSWPQTKRD
ncbi:MAG TPA: aldo/keto reductase [Thermoanaerobaculia bacterium]|jgi:aryl-alcohol dehydrogenase-like predicted oxidoreductase